MNKMHDLAGAQRPVEAHVWMALLSLYGKIYNRLNRQMLRDYGITLAKYDVLAQLVDAPDGRTLGELTSELKVTGGNVTGLTRRLLDDGLIVRESSITDRRSFIIRLLPQGRETFLAAQVMHDGVLRDWLGKLSEDELDSALLLLRRMNAVVP
ncbi:MarR family transcriptional regulator [Novosphingobium sp. SG707]|uniref:MarR family winged helix-turn-helix transcriptional regulator n=1 Tax=Novosphingobium sp. SG707 TaxID=2586996 RepID=UPI0014456CD9|nr:MarR family transcriptional regulator [Novosphingobium sp. SG707]NKI98090.1 DNA-binding MarR family transcriptional regulator [Novosphingobium sp. SG707]